MEELVKKLNEVPDSYFDFVAGVISYVKMSQSRLEKVADFLNTHENLTTTDILEFIVSQPDFHQYGVGFKKEMVG